jgi:hypothetical protein
MRSIRISCHEEDCAFAAPSCPCAAIEGASAFDLFNGKKPVKMSKKRVTSEDFMALFPIRNG